MRARSRWAALGTALGAALVVACPTRGEPSDPRGDASMQDASIVRDAAPDAALGPTPITVVTSAPSMPAPPSLDPDFTHRLRHLLDAIGANDAALCHDVQLPRKAYVDDYASKSLVKTWDRGVDLAFKKSLARAHRRNKRVELTFVSLDVPKAMVLAPAREREGWTTPLWRVERAKLHARARTQAPGETKDIVIDIASLVNWRGAWYVERL